jgi:hypothetical protein
MTTRIIPNRYRQWCFVCGLLLLPQVAMARVGDLVSHEPTDADLRLVQQQIVQAKNALSRLRALPIPVPAQKRQELDRRIARAETALKQYKDLVKRGKPRKRAQGIFYAAGAILVLDDASLVGTADDVLLPIVALGTLATKLLTYGPPSLPELAGAWKDVTTTMESAGQEADRVKQEAARKLNFSLRSVACRAMGRSGSQDYHQESRDASARKYLHRV